MTRIPCGGIKPLHVPHEREGVVERAEAVAVARKTNEDLAAMARLELAQVG